MFVKAKIAVGISNDEWYDLVSLRHLRKDAVILRVNAREYVESVVSVEDHPSTVFMRVIGIDNEFVELIVENGQPKNPFKLRVSEVLGNVERADYFWSIHKILSDGIG